MTKLAESMAFSSFKKAFSELKPNSKLKLIRKLEKAITMASNHHEKEILKHFLLKSKLGKQYIIPFAIQYIMELL